MLNSNQLKALLLQYYRFSRGMYAANEVFVSCGIADILAITKDKKSSYEVEIKTSISDFKADFKNKDHKHGNMLHCPVAVTPNYYSFCVPFELLDDVRRFVRQPYGLYTFDKRHSGWKFKCIQKQKRICDTPNERLFNLLTTRVMNENIRLWKKEYQATLVR